MAMSLAARLVRGRESVEYGRELLQFRADLLGKEPHASFGIFDGHSRVAENAGVGVHVGAVLKVHDLFVDLLGRTVNLQADEESSMSSSPPGATSRSYMSAWCS